MRKLGGSGLEVAPIGFGCMSLSGVYGASEDAAGERLVRQAVEAGVTLIDTADIYGNGHNEQLVGRALRGLRDRVVLATKFGQRRQPDGSNAVDGSPAWVAQACEASLKRLGVEAIDLWFQHRVDPAVPIEETVGAMARLVQQGKVRAIGLSEPHPDTIRRAHKVHPIAAVQSEYSLLYRREAEAVLAVTRALGIGFVAYSPLGRSLLAGGLGAAPAFAAGDTRGRHPRFAAENLAHNLALVEALAAIARGKGCTPAQLALAWVLAQGEDIVPIPGTKSEARLRENLGALNVALSPADLARIEAAVPPGAAAGERYPAQMLQAVWR